MTQNYLLPLLLMVPLVGAIVGALLPTARAARSWALLVSLGALAIGLGLAWQHFAAIPDLSQASAAAKQSQSFALRFFPSAASGTEWLAAPSVGLAFSLAMDSISLWLVLLTVFLTPLALMFSFGSIRVREKEYYAWMLALLFAMLGVFVARDLILFYVFFIIGIWGGPEKRYAAGKFFLFTFAGSIFTLAGVIFLGMQRQGSPDAFDIPAIIYWAQHNLTGSQRFWIALAFLAGFAVKVPLFPVHTWLPLAHTEAPTAGSVILAGVLLKLGTYGLLRLAVPLGFISADGVTNLPLLHVIGALCVIGVLYGALVAWVQQDIKKLVAYSSVSHLGFCVLGLMALNDIGMQGSILYMINHGLSTGAMFLVIGMIYDRYHTRDINELSGLAKLMPKMAFFFILFTLASIGLPGTNGFVSEFLTILGAFTSEHLGMAYAIPAALGVILGAVYMLHMVARVIFGPVKVPGGHGHHGHDDSHGGDPHGDSPRLPVDLSGREVAVLAPIALLCLVLGVYPAPMLRSLAVPVENTRSAQVNPARTSLASPAPAAAATVATLDKSPVNH